MAFDVTFYNFPKRVNSTALPTQSTPSTIYSCQLKTGTEVLQPTILLNTPLAVAYNYVYIQTFGRYYFVKNWRNVSGNLWEIDLKVDVLGTFKSVIGSSYQYVVRSASAYDGSVSDTMYPVTNSVSVGSYSITDLNININVSSGYYVVGIISPESSNSGAVTYYVFNSTQFGLFKNALLSTTNWLNVSSTEISADFLKTMFNPFQYIVSCRWFPAISASVLTAVTEIKFGWWTLAVSAYKYNSVYSFNTISFTVANNNLPKHPLSATRGNYLNRSPFAEYYLVMAPFGFIKIPDSFAGNSAGLYGVWVWDYYTGDCTLNLFNSGVPLLRANGKIGVDIQMAQVASNVGGVASSIASGIGGALGSALTGNVGGVISNALNGITSAVAETAPTVQTSGGTGSFSAISQFGGSASLQCRFHGVANEDYTHLGRPLCARRQISTLSGYIKCADSEIAINCTDTEMNEIVNMMDSGFFYE